MGDLENDEMGFRNSNEGLMNCPSTMAMGSFYGSGWDPLVSFGQSENFGAASSMVSSHGEFSNSFPVVLENHGGSGTAQQGVQYPTDLEMSTKLPCFGSGNYSDMFGSSFGLAGQILGGCSSNYRNAQTSQENLPLSGEETAVGSPNGKIRKRALDSTFPFSPNKKSEVKLKKDVSGDSSSTQEEKNAEMEQNLGGNSRGKATGKQTKEKSNNSAEAPKENYIHVRARRGQATNSHSLAERVRREKISERMRLLQELVPGCNKITGKAVMLDEIINYVQSLQQQVEFLSMKLATVNPDVNIDIERILSKDIFHARGSNGTVLGFDPGLSAVSPVPPHRMFQFQGAMSNMATTSTQFPPLPQTMLESDIQSLLQMGFDSGSALDNLGPNGRLKPEP
ncbi:unnamed protein product [Citrullus colocynthis]|uniref:BHLH domain-containing protein n=1 Tax=Citrullus colocynthis TaxID=252529 RepID=A0ABP0Y9U6_9ROSI